MVRRNILSIIVAAGITYLSLLNSDKFPKVPNLFIHNIDKIVHFFMYFIFMSAIIIANRKIIKSTRQLVLVATIPLFYGILIEILQATLTVNRNGSFFDAVFNFAGITTSVLLWLIIKPLIKDPVR